MMVSVVRPRKSIFSRPSFSRPVHVVLGDDFVPVGLVQRDQILQRLGRDDDAGGVHAGVARQAFQALRDVQHFLDARILRWPGRRSRGSILMRLFELDVERLVGTSLVMRSTSPKLMSSTRPTSLMAALAPKVPKVMICATCSRPYFSVTYWITSPRPLHAEVDIDIGHADAFGIQEALEQQAVLQRDRCR